MKICFLGHEVAQFTLKLTEDCTKLYPVINGCISIIKTSYLIHWWKVYKSSVEYAWIL